MSSRGKRVFWRELVFDVPEDVYEPAEDTFLLARNLTVAAAERVLDMGTGCGFLAVVAAEKASRVVAVDSNPFAVACARKNAEQNGVAAKVEPRLGELFEAVKEDERFHLIVFNAPYVPVEQTEGGSWVETAWAGGETGRTVIDRFIDRVSQHLESNGRVLLVQSSLANVEETLTRFEQRGLRALIVDEEKLDFEKLVVIKARTMARE